MSKTFAKIGAIAVGATFALSLSVNTAGAVTVAELQAQINALMAQLASLQGTATVSANFTTDLTVGSTGSQVVALQQMLVAQGHLVMPAGVAYGYFGSLTKAAVAKWQAANGIAPAAGYFGPLSRAKANSMGGATGTVPGTTIGGGATAGGTITTPGVEGTLTITANPTPISGVKVYEGDTRAAVLGLRLDARTSDVRIERVTVRIPNVTFYNKIASRVYIMDGSTVVGSADLNSNTVVTSGGNSDVTVSGMSYVVPKNTIRVLNVAFDFMSSIDSAYKSGTMPNGHTVSVQQNGVRGVDGAGINLYGPSSAISRNFVIESNLAEQAALQLSLNAGNLAAAEVIASAGTGENERDGLELIRFDAKAEKADVKLKNVTVTIARGGNTSTATATTAYLYDGSNTTPIASAVVNASSATAMTALFENVDLTVSKDATRTLSVKVDIRSAGAAATTFQATGVTVTAENPVGGSITPSGTISAGSVMTVRNAGPELMLNSKSITKSSTQTGTSTAQATFNLTVKAVGGAVSLQDSGAFLFEARTSSATSTVTAVSYSLPTSLAAITNGRLLPENQSVTIPVTVIYSVGPNTAVNTYSLALRHFIWSLDATNAATATVISDFMANRLEWRTDPIVLP